MTLSCSTAARVAVAGLFPRTASTQPISAIDVGITPTSTRARRMRCLKGRAMEEIYVARPANQPVAAPAMLPPIPTRGNGYSEHPGTSISPAAITASRTSGIARPAPQRPDQ